MTKLQSQQQQYQKLQDGQPLTLELLREELVAFTGALAACMGPACMEKCVWPVEREEERAARAAYNEGLYVCQTTTQEKNLLPEQHASEEGASLGGKFVLGATSAEEEDELLQQEAHELEEQQLEQEEAHERHIVRNRLGNHSKHDEHKKLPKEKSTVLDKVAGFIGSTLRPEAAVFCPSSSSVQERVQVNSQNQMRHHTFKPGDYVKLAALKNQELNGEMGKVQEKLETGRFRVVLGCHKLNQKVCIKPENLEMVETGERIAEVTKLRDDGRSVADLIAEGYTVSAIQLDCSEKQCEECCRPRYMCSCTYAFMDRP
jgi:hypothetical protein